MSLKYLERRVSKLTRNSIKRKVTGPIIYEDSGSERLYWIGSNRYTEVELNLLLSEDEANGFTESFAYLPKRNVSQPS